MNELHAPPLDEKERPVEMARIWIAAEEGRSHIALNYGIFEARELEIWGSLAADLIAHAVRAYHQDGGTATAAEAFAAIEKGLRERLSDNPTMSGDFSNKVLM
ncbi:DUF5076 domain-containing protein [Phenylobacterium sp.]|uniref:DUF5076 domain-containing protein n=1 Tax=Phenylobacterium sp. TaxID=1871053 RepID=UPI003D2B7354